MSEATVIALGFFDGVHLGHGALLRKTAERARELGVTPAAFTFDRSPKEFVTGVPVPLLTSAAERAEIIRDMRLDVFDVLVGINLLREGLDIPEISLVAILDADKEGFLRSRTSLVQTIGRAARNAEGHVIMYADVITDSMREAIDETNRRREIQDAYNKAHGIVPKTIKKDVRDLISVTRVIDSKDTRMEKDMESMSKKELKEVIERLSKKMNQAAAELNFELAAQLRDELKEFKIAYQEYDD